MMQKPRFLDALWRMAWLMLAAFALVLLIRGPLLQPLIFSAMPLAALLDDVLNKPLMGMLGSRHRLDAAIWLMIGAAYLQWTLLGAMLAHFWRTWRYRHFMAKQAAEVS